jgi:IS605 OrfB family transposase
MSSAGISSNFKVNLIFESKTPEKIGDKVIGIDRGLYNIVSLSDGFKYFSNKIRKNKRKFLFLRKQLQTKGTPSAKRKLKNISGREKRFSLNENHVISKRLVNMPYDIFVLEDLKGIRKQKSKGKKLNKWLSNWSFWQLEQFITYKAEALGKQIVKVDARYTSQKCSNCNLIEKLNRKGSHYNCERCGYNEHADINAARNIHNNYISIAAKKIEQVASQSTKCFQFKN